MFSSAARPVITMMVLGVLTLLFLADPAQAQCSRGGGRRGSPGFSPQYPMRMTMQQQAALPQQIALLTALQRQNTLQQITDLVAALKKRQTTLQTGLDKTRTSLTGLEKKLDALQGTTGSQPAASILDLQKKQTALLKKQARLEKTLQQTTTLLTKLQNNMGQGKAR